jgi:hypothetical protein
LIKLTNEIALITAVSDLRMFLDIVNDVTFEFPRIESLSDGEKSPSGPIKTEIGLPCFNVSAFKFFVEFTSANNNFEVPSRLSKKSFSFVTSNIFGGLS